MDNAYHAADLCCPNCVKREKPMLVDGLYAICPLCEEEFDLSYGYAIPTKGKTKEAMKKYNTSYRNMATGAQLYIYN
jgi:nitrite reductase/ring-hydroxylating ferredoxin subunit